MDSLAQGQISEQRESSFHFEFSSQISSSEVNPLYSMYISHRRAGDCDEAKKHQTYLDLLSNNQFCLPIFISYLHFSFIFTFN